MLKNQSIQIEADQTGCVDIEVALAVRPGITAPWARALLTIGALILCQGNNSWAATGGLFISASPIEISGGLLLMGLSLTASVFGLRMILRSIMVRPTR